MNARAISQRRKEWLIPLAIVICVAAMILVLSPPVILRSKKPALRAEAINNIKQIALDLQIFDADYGSFPSDATVAKVREATDTGLSLTGSSSNAMFRQLIATGTRSEKPFHCAGKGTHKPDDQFADDAHALAAGECGFAYVAGLSSSFDPNTPVVMAPMVPGTRRFDPSIFDGKAVILFLDNSAKALEINSAGQAILNHMDLFDPRQPFWHGKAPDLRLPE